MKWPIAYLACTVLTDPEEYCLSHEACLHKVRLTHKVLKGKRRGRRNYGVSHLHFMLTMCSSYRFLLYKYKTTICLVYEVRLLIVASDCCASSVYVQARAAYR